MLLTSFGRVRRMTERAAQRLPEPVDVLELDVNSPEDLAALTGTLKERWGGVDGALHAIAFAPEDALGGRFMTAPAESASQAFQTSAFSLKALAAALAPLMAAARASSEWTSTPAWRGRSTTGWASRRRRSSPSRAISPAISARRGSASTSSAAGPLGTVAARGIPGFERLASLWQRQAPLGWDIDDPGPVADTICFLLSDYARGSPARSCTSTAGFTRSARPGICRALACPAGRGVRLVP